jgi:hypothetical protein
LGVTEEVESVAEIKEPEPYIPESWAPVVGGPVSIMARHASQGADTTCQYKAQVMAILLKGRVKVRWVSVEKKSRLGLVCVGYTKVVRRAELLPALAFRRDELEQLREAFKESVDVGSEAQDEAHEVSGPV